MIRIWRKFQHLAIWICAILLFIGIDDVPIRHVLLPDDARATDSLIALMLLLMFEWILDIYHKVVDK